MRTVSEGYAPVKRGKDSWLLRVSVSEDGKPSKRLSKTVHCRTKTEEMCIRDRLEMETCSRRRSPPAPMKRSGGSGGAAMSGKPP